MATPTKSESATLPTSRLSGGYLAEAVRRGIEGNFDTIIDRLKVSDVLDQMIPNDLSSEQFCSNNIWRDFQKIRALRTGWVRAQALLEAVFDQGDEVLAAFVQAVLTVHGDDEKDILKLLVVESGDAVRTFRRRLGRGTFPSEQSILHYLQDSLAQLHERSLRLSCDYGYLPEDAPSYYYVDTDILEVKKEEALRTMGMEQKQADASGGREVWVSATSQVVYLRDLPLGEGYRTSLVVGAPGAGKTRLCLEFLQQWASGKSPRWRKIRFPFFIQARELSRALATCPSETEANWLGFLCLSELAIGGLTKEEQMVVWKYLRIHSDEAVIILDGIDELDADLLNSRNSYLFQLVHRSVLPSCSLLVTSRPCEKAVKLVHWADKHYQIKGMSANQLRGMMKMWLGEKATCELVKQLNGRPQLKNAVSIPLVATMVLRIVLADHDHELPHSLSECYELIVKGLLLHYAERSLSDTPLRVHDLGNCPPRVKRVLTSLESIALDLMVSNTPVISKSEVKKIRGSLAALDSGLLVQSRRHSDHGGYEASCGFIHSTFQEYFAARAVARDMDRVDMGNCIQTCLMTVGTDLHTHTFWLFLASMLHVKHVVKLLQALHRSVKSSSFLQRKYVITLILHCLAQRTSDMAKHDELSITNILASKSLDLSNYQLSDGDFAAFARVLHFSTGLRELHLVDCCLYPARCQELVQCNGFRPASILEFGANPLLKGESVQYLSDGIAKLNMSITSLSLRSCWLTEDDAFSVSRLVISQRLLKVLILTQNNFNDAGIAKLSAALRGCTALEVLDVEMCGLSADGAAELAKVFAGMTSLKIVSARRNSLGNRGARCILEGLAGNRHLCDLRLDFTSIDEALCDCLQEFVRQHAERVVDLADNQLSIKLTGNNLRQRTRCRLLETLTSRTRAFRIAVSFGHCMIDAAGVHELDHSTLLDGEVLYYGKYNERDIGYQGLGELTGERLANIVSRLNDVDCLCLEQNGIDDEVLTEISSAVARNPRTLAFDLGFNAVTFNGVFSLATALSQYNKTLRYVNFEGNNLLGSEGDPVPTSDVVSKGLELLLQHCPNLQFLGLAVTGIRDVDVLALCCYLLPNCPLLFLSLSRNNITDNSIVELSHCLKKNKALRILLLHGNPITAAGVKCLAELQRIREADALDVISLTKIPSAEGLPGLVETPMVFTYSMEILDLLDSLVATS